MKGTTIFILAVIGVALIAAAFIFCPPLGAALAGTGASALPSLGMLMAGMTFLAPAIGKVLTGLSSFFESLFKAPKEPTPQAANSTSSQENISSLSEGQAAPAPTPSVDSFQPLFAAGPGATSCSPTPLPRADKATEKATSHPSPAAS
jgi:hypothetical protein